MILRRKAILSLSILSLLAAGHVGASDFDRKNGHHFKRESHRHDRHSHRRPPSQSGVSSAGLPSVIPGLGTYVGNVAAVRIKGVGTYFVADRGPTVIEAPTRGTGARIIVIGEEADACRYEVGVCVVRP